MLHDSNRFSFSPYWPPSCVTDAVQHVKQRQQVPRGLWPARFVTGGSDLLTWACAFRRLPISVLRVWQLAAIPYTSESICCMMTQHCPLVVQNFTSLPALGSVFLATLSLHAVGVQQSQRMLATMMQLVQL